MTTRNLPKKYQEIVDRYNALLAENRLLNVRILALKIQVRNLRAWAEKNESKLGHEDMGR